MATLRLHVTMGTYPHLDFLEFIQSVVGGLLKTISCASSGPNGRIIINTSIGLYHHVNVELKNAAQTKKKHCKNMSRMWWLLAFYVLLRLP